MAGTPQHKTNYCGPLTLICYILLIFYNIKLNRLSGIHGVRSPESHGKRGVPMENTECGKHGVPMENTECGKHKVWKTQSVENTES